MAGGGGNQPIGQQSQQNGLPKFQNKAVRHNIGTTQGVANQGLPQVQGISAPAGVSPNSQGLNASAPTFPMGNPALYGSQIPGQQGPMSKTGPMQNNNVAFPGGGAGAGAGTPSQNLPTQGGGPANTGNMANQYAENVLSGQFLNPDSNPYERGQMDVADKELIQNYMTAIAPTTNAEMAMAGNFGGSAMMDAQANNEYQLGQGLAATNTGIANNAYNTGIGQLENTVGNLGGIQQSQYTPSFMPLNYQNQANQGLMSLMQPYGYQQNKQGQPADTFTPAQGVGAGLGLVGLGMQP